MLSGPLRIHVTYITKQTYHVDCDKNLPQLYFALTMSLDFIQELGSSPLALVNGGGPGLRR